MALTLTLRQFDIKRAILSKPTRITYGPFSRTIAVSTAFTEEGHIQFN